MQLAVLPSKPQWLRHNGGKEQFGTENRDHSSLPLTQKVTAMRNIPPTTPSPL
jgi:hypothetical protein